MRQSMYAGILAALAAACSWSLSFIVPFVIGDYSLFDFALVQFVISGMLGVGLLWKNQGAVRRLRLDDWFTGCSLGLIGYVGYFLAVMGAAIYAGPVVAPAFIGLVPVVLGIAGNLRERTVSWASLSLPLTLAAVGLILVNSGGLSPSSGLRSKSLSVGIPLALLAVTLWTTFGLLNQSTLARRPRMQAEVWTAAGMALFANLGGAMAWTFASQRLPVALAAQLITMEPASATILGLFVHRRWPSVPEALGMLVLLAGVIIAIGLFSRAAYFVAPAGGEKTPAKS